MVSRAQGGQTDARTVTGGRRVCVRIVSDAAWARTCERVRFRPNPAPDFTPRLRHGASAASAQTVGSSRSDRVDAGGVERHPPRRRFRCSAATLEPTGFAEP